jgi:glycosyltransferase involved in cell wall biosynthesis
MAEFAFENPDKVREAEILVGIPSRNEAESIGFVTEQASLGLTRYFPGRTVAVVNCDNNSKDGTRESFFNAPCQVPRIYVSTPEGVSGKGNNIKNLYRVAGELKAKAIVVLDADTKSVTPKWVKNLAEPLLSDYAFVSPLYLSHKYDAALTNHIVYPLSRCLYGRRIRQPIGGEFGFTGELARFFLGHESWTDSAAHFGVDIYMTTLAMYYGKPISQAFLGSPKIHRPMNPRNALGPGFREVVGTLFHLQTVLPGFWKDVRHSRPTAIFGFGAGETENPEQIEIDRGALYKALREGYERYKEIWSEILAGETFSKLEEVIALEEQHFELPINLWAHILFDMSVAYRDKIAPPDQLTESLVPLYQGRILSFAKNTEGLLTGQAEEYIEEECLDFEEAKPYLLKRWG